MAPIPDDYRDLFEKPVTVSLATLLPDGHPQVTPVWCDFDGEHIRVNTAKGRQKYRDMTARPRVTVLAVDPENHYRYIEVRGRVARSTEEGADAHIDSLARKYMGVDTYPLHRPDETRVIFFIEPQRVSTQG